MQKLILVTSKMILSIISYFPISAFFRVFIASVVTEAAVAVLATIQATDFFIISFSLRLNFLTAAVLSSSAF